MRSSVDAAVKAADPARGLDPVVPLELRGARTDAITAQPLEHQPARRSRRRTRVVALAATAAAAVSVVGMVVGSEDRGGLPGTAAAFAHQMRAGEGILHIVGGPGRTVDTRGNEERFDATEEAWVALDGSGYRMRLPGPDGSYRDDVMDGSGNQWRYDSRTGRVRSFPAERPLGRAERLGDLTTGAFVAAQLMGDGQLRSAGETTVNGQRAHRLVLEGTGPNRYEYDVAIDRVRLLRVSMTAANPRFPDAPTTSLEADITTFEILPDTPANRALTRIQTP